MSLFSSIKKRVKKIGRNLGNVVEKVASNEYVQLGLTAAGTAYGIPPQATGSALSLFGDDEPVASPVPMPSYPPRPPSYFLPQPQQPQPYLPPATPQRYINAPTAPRSLGYAGVGAGATQCAAATGDAWVSMPEMLLTVGVLFAAFELGLWMKQKCLS